MKIESNENMEGWENPPSKDVVDHEISTYYTFGFSSSWKDAKPWTVGGVDVPYIGKYTSGRSHFYFLGPFVFVVVKLR